MSQSTNNQPKVISRYEFQVNEDLKNAVQVFQNEMRLTRKALAALKPVSASDGLLKAMSVEAVNDDHPELKELGQWVFEGQEECWIHAVADKYGKGFLFKEVPTNSIHMGAYDGLPHKFIGYGFCPDQKINRETVNDVDYLSDDDLNDSVPHIDDVLAQPNWLSDSVPQITQADLQLIFIKNLSTTLIQRMHSMDRFSEDDYEVGGLNIEPWDIVVGQFGDQDCFAVVTGTQSAEDIRCSKIDIILLEKSECRNRIASTGFIYFDTNDTYRTITADEIPLFREALEACYA